MIMESAYKSLRVKSRHKSFKAKNWWNNELELLKNNFHNIRNRYFHDKKMNVGLEKENEFRRVSILVS